MCCHMPEPCGWQVGRDVGADQKKWSLLEGGGHTENKAKWLPGMNVMTRDP